MNFTRENYKTFLQYVKSKVTDFHTPGNGIIIRHDVDDMIERSAEMALLEYEAGVKSTYFILDTAGYWQDERTFACLRDMQNKLGHEIGWHNNAITVHFKTNKPIRDCIYEPLLKLRSEGLKVFLTAAHGDPLCHERNYVNYNVFGYQSNGWNGYKGEKYNPREFGILFDVMHGDNRDGYLSDSGGKWSLPPAETIERFMTVPGRYQILIHPQWWAL